MTEKHLLEMQNDCAVSVGEDLNRLFPLRNANLLVTGGTGFVGSWIAEMTAFLNDCHGFKINLALLAPRASDFRSRAPHLASRRDIELIEADVRSLVEVPRETNWIIHAAGTPDNRFHFSHPIKTFETIVVGTHSLLNAASRLSALQRVLCLSSGLVYGPQHWEDALLAENAFTALDCNNFANLYAESKRAAEMLTAAYRSQYGVPVLNARLFAFIGPYQLLDRPWAINNFLRDALRGGPIRLQGSGETVRSYLYGSDLAFWLLNILVSGNIGGAYNVGSPKGISLRDLAAKIADDAPRRPSIELNTLPSGKVSNTRWLPDVSLAQGQCGLQVRIDLDQAIGRTVAWHAERILQHQ